MFLKSLNLKGFKSFADTTRLDFEPGVTVVVGPNGSGKSNLVDAIAWVLGSQSPSSIRSSKMEDVIFAGSQRRSVLGRAEVALVLDNESGILPLDFPEVVISRTLVRNGDSEYGINGSPARLMDVTDLLSDGGMGRSQHTIVSQGEVDAVLNDRSEDRRNIIEEAAGVLKHRKRRERAEKRLGETDSDLSRLRDLLREVGRQLEPLERQAEAAKKHGEMLEHLSDLRIYAAGQELKALKREKENLSSRHREYKAKESELAENQTRLNEEIKEQESRLDEFGEDLSGENLADLESLKARVFSATSQLKEKALKLSAETKTISEIEEAEEQRTEKEAELDEASAKVEEFRKKLAVETENQEQITQTESKINKLQAEISALENVRTQVQKDQSEAGSKLEDYKRRLEQAAVQLKAQEKECSDAESEHLIWISKLEALAMTEEFSSASAASSGAPSGSSSGKRQDASLSDIDILGDLVEAEAGYERAVAAGLGEAVNSILTGGADEGKEMLRRLEEKGTGGTVLPVKNTAGTAAVDAERDKQKGADETALRSKVWIKQGAESQRYGETDELALLLDSLTGSILVVDNWAEALELHLETRLTVVSREGDRFSSTGWQLAKLNSHINQAETELTKAARNAAEAEARASLSELEVVLAASRRKLDDLKAQEQKMLVEQKALESQIETSLKKLAEAENSLPELKSALAELEEQQKTYSSRKEQELDSVQENLKAAESRHKEIEMFLSANAEKLQILNSQISSEGDSDASSIEKLKVMTALNEFFNRAHQEIEKQIEKERELRRQKSEESKSSLQKLSTSRMEKETVESELGELKENLTRAEIAFAEVSTRLDNAVESLERDLECSPAKAMEVELPEFLDGADPDERIKEIEHELRLIGPINHLALKEYENIKSRHSFLSEQIEDIKSAKKELKKLIKTVDLEMANAFESAFTDIARNFEELFQIAFPNGEGSLSLNNPQDLLATGVEIKARPGEKKVKRLSLLSGGERSLVALTFLFAVLKARPAPFCILDEVDAALDDINLCRFLDLVQELVAETQLMIVSHQKRTMESADFLYGVSMTNEGTTKVISEKRSVAVAV